TTYSVRTKKGPKALGPENQRETERTYLPAFSFLSLFCNFVSLSLLGRPLRRRRRLLRLVPALLFSPPFCPKLHTNLLSGSHGRLWQCWVISGQLCLSLNSPN
ncbi:unnamed protein product, partial [Prunus brigantina]